MSEGVPSFQEEQHIHDKLKSSLDTHPLLLPPIHVFHKHVPDSAEFLSQDYRKKIC